MLWPRVENLVLQSLSYGCKSGNNAVLHVITKGLQVR